MVPQFKAEKIFELKKHLQIYLHLPLSKGTSGAKVLLALKKHNLDLQKTRSRKILQLHDLEENSLITYENAKVYKSKVRKWHDAKIQEKEFQVGEKVLLCNSKLKLFPRKLNSRWFRPFMISQVFPNRIVTLKEDYV